MQDEYGDERLTEGEAGGEPEPSEILRKCVQAYRDVTMVLPRAGNRVLDYVT